jgi:hypothetical protein
VSAAGVLGVAVDGAGGVAVEAWFWAMAIPPTPSAEISAALVATRDLRWNFSNIGVPVSFEGMLWTRGTVGAGDEMSMR